MIGNKIGFYIKSDEAIEKKENLVSMQEYVLDGNLISLCLPG